MSRASFPLLALLAVVVVASPAVAHAAELTFTFLEGEECPEDRVSCIRVTGGPGTEGNIPDDTAEVRFEGEHPVNITVENGGDVDHNLTFEPGTAMEAYSIDEPLAPGETAEVNFTTVRDVPEGTYVFYGGQEGHRDLGERGTFEVRSLAEAEEEEGTDDQDIVREVMPGPGSAALLVALALGARGWLRRR